MLRGKGLAPNFFGHGVEKWECLPNFICIPAVPQSPVGGTPNSFFLLTRIGPNDQ
jgi:hypothetical protein